MTAVPNLAPIEDVPLASLRPHPRNYQQHPEEQLRHLIQSVASYGVYRNVVIARDGTILAGHGVVAAARAAGLDTIRVQRLDLEPDSPEALKLIVADNEVSHLAEKDDRALTDLLRLVKDGAPGGLLGTGYDESMLAALAFVTRPEVPDKETAAAWAGMPEFEGGELEWRLVVRFASEAERAAFMNERGLEATSTFGKGRVATLRWPPQEPRQDRSSVAWVAP